MANQQNYESNLADLSGQYTKYLVSRVIANKSDNLLDLEVPADFPLENLANNVEINLYSLADNSLIFSDVIKIASGSIFTKKLQYSNNSHRTLLFIDFSKIDTLDVPIGQYTVTLNFFEDELGSYDDRVLKVNKISTSRTEVELALTNAQLTQDLQQFAIPRIPVEYIEDALKQIFNQEGADSIVIPASSAKIDSASIYQNFPSGSGQLLIEYGFDEDDGSRLGVTSISQQVLDIAYPVALQSVRNMMLSGSTSFTETELNTYVVGAINLAYDQIISDEQQNPQNYRFDLI